MLAVIGLSGVRGSGKSTAFNIIKRNFPEWEEFTFARHLKDTCSKAFNIPVDYFEDASLKEEKLEKPVTVDFGPIAIISREFGVGMLSFEKVSLTTPRQILQYVGTEVLRRNNPMIHIEKALNALPKEGYFISTSTRFINEFSALEEKFGDMFFPLYISRSDAEENAGTHRSERQPKKLKPKCYVIENNGTEEELEEKVKEYMISEVYSKLGEKNARSSSN